MKEPKFLKQLSNAGQNASSKIGKIYKAERLLGEKQDGKEKPTGIWKIRIIRLGKCYARMNLLCHKHNMISGSLIP